MSELQRAWARQKVGLPSDAIHGESEEQEFDEVPELPEHPQEHPPDDDSSSASSASSVSSTGTIIPSPNQRLFARPQGCVGVLIARLRLTIARFAKGRTMEQIPWMTFFERELYLCPEESQQVTYHAYLTSPTEKGPLFVMHHGGGSSGLSFAVVGSEIRKGLPHAGILSPDCRGHGSTTTQGDTQPDLSLETLSTDLYNVVMLTKKQMGWRELPPIILVGHSLGGAVVTDLAKSGRLGNSLLGYAVLDVVEGSAMDALQSMQTYLSTRPAGFASVQAGIEWHVRSRTIRNSTSARTSVPALLVLDEHTDSSRPWRWRTNLAASQPYWEEWFKGLSKKFLEARGGKLLLLAGTDRLDTELTIGQMQGELLR